MAIVKSAGGQPLMCSMPKGSCSNNTGSLTSSKDTILGSEQTGNLHDRYQLGDELGLGQFGKIRYCTDKVTGEVLACKSIAKDRLVTSEDVRSVKLEIEIMTSLSGHPNVVALKAVFEEEEYVHLVMELCAGGELFDQLQKQGRYSEPDAARLFKHLMEVVKYCHDNGVVHRDLKPENILLATKSPSSPIKLADFGLATYFTPGQKLNGTVGSPFYIAPEVLSGGYNQAADVWSAGVILYILLSGIPPFWGKTKSKIFDAVREAKLQFPKDNWGSISSSAKDLISRMLCTDPKKRLTSVEVLEHPWITGQVELSRHSSNGVKGKQGITCNSLSSGEPKTMASFSSAFDYNNKTDILSSFSGFIVTDNGCQVLGSFAFNPKTNGSEYSSTIQNTLSFAFANIDGTFNSEHSVSFSDNKMQHQLSQREQKLCTQTTWHREKSGDNRRVLQASCVVYSWILMKTVLLLNLCRFLRKLIRRIMFSEKDAYGSFPTQLNCSRSLSVCCLDWIASGSNLTVGNGSLAVCRLSERYSIMVAPMMPSTRFESFPLRQG